MKTTAIIVTQHDRDTIEHALTVLRLINGSWARRIVERLDKLMLKMYAGAKP